MELQNNIKKLQVIFKDEKKNTRTGYINRFKRVYNNVKDINNPHQVKEFIDSISNGSQSPTLRGFVKCCMALKMEVPPIYKDLCKEYSLREKNNTHLKPKENNKKFSYSKVKKVLDELKDVYIRWIIGSYWYLPPIRPGEYINMMILNKDDSKYEGKNRVILDDKLMIVEDHKTKDKLGIKKIDLNNDFINLILDVKKVYDPVYMFSNQKRPDKPICRQNIGRIFRKYLDTSPNELRNFYISEKIDDPKINMKDRERIAYILGHSIATENSIYSKYSIMTHSKDIKEKMRAMMKGLDPKECYKILNDLANEKVKEI